MVESSPSRQRRPACKTSKGMTDEAAVAAALTYLLPYCYWSPTPVLVVTWPPMLLVTSVFKMVAHHVCSQPVSECLVDCVLQGYIP